MRVAAALVAAVATVVTTMPTANASVTDFCGELGGAWDGTTCTAVVVSNRKAEMLLSLGLPQEFVDNPAVGPIVKDFYRKLAAGWRKTGTETPRDSSARSVYEIYPGPGQVKSLIVHETYEPFGMQGNNAYRTFVFDMGSGRRLALADLFKPGVDAVAAVSSAAAPLLPDALAAAQPPHAPETYPFTLQEWQPGPDGAGYSGDYRGFGLAQDALVLYMPDEPLQRENPSPQDRLVWSMDGGTVILRVPLAALAGSLRPAYGGT